VEQDHIIFRKAHLHEINNIYMVLVKAFDPYKKYYTKDAFKATVLSPSDLQHRFVRQKYEIFVVVVKKHVVGTVSVSMNDRCQLYLRSMAVLPEYQKRGIGHFMLQELIKLAERKKVKNIMLDTSKPLKGALQFYKNFGFEFTGVSKIFYGVKIWEMIFNL
jgi:ribosomal protein S18 acetylase RimI-like enzyme